MAFGDGFGGESVGWQFGPLSGSSDFWLCVAMLVGFLAAMLIGFQAATLVGFQPSASDKFIHRIAARQSSTTSSSTDATSRLEADGTCRRSMLLDIAVRESAADTSVVPTLAAF